jgi:hypothetical protein
MIWTYCEQWNRLTESPMNPLTSQGARARHVSGDLYTAVAFRTEHSSPELCVHIRLETGYAAVIFIDGYGRNSLEYTFSLINESLFLETATYYAYGSSQARGGYADAEYMDSYDFTPDGIMEKTEQSGGDESHESRQGVDVSSNWEPVPSFGAYDSLIRRDRA